MDILFLLIPLSVMLVLIILGGLCWAIYSGQFEDIDAEGERILHEDWPVSSHGQKSLRIINPDNIKKGVNNANFGDAVADLSRYCR